jgi:amidase
MSTWIVREEGGRRGLRVAVKDLIDLAGLPTTAASRAVAGRALPAEADAACIAGLRAAERRGEAHVAGKVNLHELAFGISGVNPWYGTPVNPLDPTLVPGGSSSGSAVAVAGGEADIAFGSDTGGSVRIPAACCGITGLKTTWGRVPLDGVWPLSPSLDTVGPMAADVAGVARGMALLEPGFTVAAEAPGRVGRIHLDADPVIERAVDEALAAAELDVAPARFDGLAEATDAAMVVLGAEAWTSNRDLVVRSPEGIGADVRERLTASSRITPAGLAAARVEGVAWTSRLEVLWERFDLLALPTLLGFPVTIDRAPEMMTIRGLTAPVNLAGIPALALPIPAAGPLPASLQLLAPHGGEELLLAAGALIEAAVAR